MRHSGHMGRVLKGLELAAHGCNMSVGSQRRLSLSKHMEEGGKDETGFGGLEKDIAKHRPRESHSQTPTSTREKKGELLSSCDYHGD